MSNHPRGPLDLSPVQAEAFRRAIAGIEFATGMPLVGLLFWDDEQLCLIPQPGLDEALLDVLDTGSWKEARRVVREHRG